MHIISLVTRHAAAGKKNINKNQGRSGIPKDSKCWSPGPIMQHRTESVTHIRHRLIKYCRYIQRTACSITPYMKICAMIYRLPTIQQTRATIHGNNSAAGRTIQPGVMLRWRARGATGTSISRQRYAVRRTPYYSVPCVSWPVLGLRP